jgi:probable F420-dependent oxidoreductase
MIQLAAAETAGVLTYFTPPERTGQVRTAIGPEKWLGAEQAGMLESNPTRARAEAREYMRFYFQIPHYPRMLSGLGFTDADFADGGSDRLVDAIVAWGSPETIRARLGAHYAAGATHVCILPLQPTGERALEALAPGR